MRLVFCHIFYLVLQILLPWQKEQSFLPMECIFLSTVIIYFKTATVFNYLSLSLVKFCKVLDEGLHYLNITWNNIIIVFMIWIRSSKCFRHNRFLLLSANITVENLWWMSYLLIVAINPYLKHFFGQLYNLGGFLHLVRI